MATVTASTRRRRVFDSVFPSLDTFSQPTPRTDFTASGQRFGGPEPIRGQRQRSPTPTTTLHHHAAIEGKTRSAGAGTDALRDQDAWNRAWHLVTTALALPPDAVASSYTPPPFQPPTTRTTRSAPQSPLRDALRDVLAPASRLPAAAHTENVVAWFSHQARHHFLHTVQPHLPQLAPAERSEGQRCAAVVATTIDMLEEVHRTYLDRLAVILREMAAMGDEHSEAALRKFRQDLHAIVSNALMDRLAIPLKALLSTKVALVLGIPATGAMPQTGDDAAAVEAARRQLLAFVTSLNNVGLGGERLHIVFADVMDEALSRYVQAAFAHVWHERDPVEDGSVLPRSAHQLGQSPCITELCRWVENKFSRVAVEVLNKAQAAKVSWNDVERWKEMGIGRLVALRIDELFDVVLEWPNSKGALDDLRAALSTPQRRLELTDVFSAALQKRLLHSGSSTLKILQAYISIIWSFHTLDSSKVLLDRVAYPLQLYLRSRDDTVRIIVAGLLADIDNETDAPKRTGQLTELAMLLHRGEEQSAQRSEDDLDWDDPDWVPDPVDAGPGYRRSKIADIIGTLINMLSAKEVFIKEFQGIIGENLLKSDGGFEKEITVLELLKARFGESLLQSCEVMIKDILDSRRVNQSIRKMKELGPSEQEPHTMDDHEGVLRPSLHAKILSRLFWPQLEDEPYNVPRVIADLQKQYEQGFEELKTSRKLTWLPALGQATVELEFADRTVCEEVHTWQATVIWAFQGGENGEVVTRTVDELAQQLQMDEDLVRRALSFWVGKYVLHEDAPDQYRVLETLNKEEQALSSAQAAEAAVGADADVDAAISVGGPAPDTAKMAVYWQYIQGMLTNAAPQMPLAQIAMMLKMLIADGFPYSNEELGDFLNEKVEAGELLFAGGKYKLNK